MSEAASITSDGSDSEFPNRRYARSYNPESNRGRRKVTVPPQSIRAGQNRDAQRAFRARKQAYVDGLKDKVPSSFCISNLEHCQQVQELTALLADNALYLECERLKQRVASLEAEKASLPSQSQSPDIHVINCSTCIAEQFKSSVLHSQLNQMESRLSSLSNENQSLKQQLAVSSVSPNFGLSSYPGTTYSVNEWLAVLQGGEESGLKSANDLYGPVELDSARIALQSVKSLHGNGVADQFLDVIDAQSKTTSPQTIRRLQVKLSICAQTALSLCTIVDRQKCIEIYANLFIRNRLQLNHIIAISQLNLPNWPKPSIATTLPPAAARFKETLSSIKSFEGAAILIDEYCGLLWSPDDSYKAIFVSLVAVHQKLCQLIQSTEDMEKYIMAFEIVKVNAKERVDLLVESFTQLDMQ